MNREESAEVPRKSPWGLAIVALALVAGTTEVAHAQDVPRPRPRPGGTSTAAAGTPGESGRAWAYLLVKVNREATVSVNGGSGHRVSPGRPVSIGVAAGGAQVVIATPVGGGVAEERTVELLEGDKQKQKLVEFRFAGGSGGRGVEDLRRAIGIWRAVEEEEGRESEGGRAGEEASCRWRHRNDVVLEFPASGLEPGALAGRRTADVSNTILSAINRYTKAGRLAVEGTSLCPGLRSARSVVGLRLSPGRDSGYLAVETWSISCEGDCASMSGVERDHAGALAQIIAPDRIKIILRDGTVRVFQRR